MKKDNQKLNKEHHKNENKSENITTNDLLFLHFNLVKQNSYCDYTSFSKKNLLDDFSQLLDKLFNKKGDC